MDWYSTIIRKGVELHGECLLWRGSLISGGYGRIVRKQPDGHILARAAHRVSYEIWIGDIPEGLMVDHACHNRAAWAGECTEGGACLHRRCINPAHLELKTHAENVRSSPLPRQRRSQCKHGHPYDATNTGIDKHGIKWCKRCKKLRDADRWARGKND